MPAAQADKPVGRFRRICSGALHEGFSRHGWKVLTVLPLLFLLIVVVSLAVPVPYLDEWNFVPLLAKFWSGRLTFEDLFAQHNEHRLLFPRLLMLLLARLTHWDIRFELGVNVLLAVGLFMVIAWQINRTAQQAAFPQLRWATPACSLIVFSISQFENWLWGWQISMMLSVLAVTSGLILLAHADFCWSRFAIATLLGLVATHSFASGILFWPLGLAVITLVARGRKVRNAVFLWGVASILGLGSFFWHYRLPTNHQPLNAFFFRATDFIGYALRFIGSICAQFQSATVGGDDSLAIGCALLLVTAGAWSLQFLVRQNRLRLATLSPYLAMMAYGILSAFMAAIGRSALGNHQALSSRYCTETVPLWASLVVILMLAAKDASSYGADSAPSEHPAGTSTLNRRRNVAALTGLILGLCALSSLFAVAEARKLSRRQECGRQALLGLLTTNMKANYGSLVNIYPEPSYILAEYPFLVKNRLTCFRNSDGDQTGRESQGTGAPQARRTGE